MTESLSNAEKWDLGCQADHVRNGFVIPELVRILSKVRPATILDVGAGTGYVAREINHQLDYLPSWTLVDTDVERTTFAKSRASDLMVQEIIEKDIMSLPDGARYDAVLVTFTLLEIDDIETCVAKLRLLMKPEAVLAVALPDAWVDVIAQSPSDPTLIERFMVDRVSIPKNDKFTGTPYPFDAIRAEFLIGLVLRTGFALEEIKRSSGANAGVFMLTFRRTAEVTYDF